jgi:Integral membrane protein
MILRHTDADTTVITLLPNRSASWAQTKLFVLVVCCTTLIIGVFWTLNGAWMVLPFSGIEAGLVAFLMYRVCQGTYQRQVITCTPQQILVQFGTTFPKRSWQLPRSSVHVKVTDAPHPLSPRILVLADGSHHIELGSFLNHEDKEEVLQHLRQAGLHVRHFNSDGRRQL